MAKNKTTTTAKSVEGFISAIADETKRDDCHKLIEIFKSLTGFEPVLWGPSIIGFGTYHYRYESGREGDMPLACFSPRKNAFVFYLKLKLDDKNEDLLMKLGKYKKAKGCVYIRKLEDVNIVVLKKLIVTSVKNIKKEYPS